MEQIYRLPLAIEVSVDVKGCCANLSIPWGPRSLAWQVLFTEGLHSTTFDFIFEAGFDPLNASEGESDDQMMTRMRLEEALRQYAPLLDIMSILLHLNLDKEKESALAATSNDPHLQFELSTLPTLTPGLKIALITSKPPATDKLWVSIPLAVSLSGIFDAIGMIDPEEAIHLQSQFALQASFAVNNISASSGGQKKEPDAPELSLNEYLSSGSSYWLSRIPAPFILPPWAKTSCLMDYVPMLTEKLQSALDALAAKLRAKHQFFDHLFTIMGPPVEYNKIGSIALFSLSSMLDTQSLPVLIHIDASNMPKFPEGGPPLLTVTNVRAMGIGDAGSTTYDGCPWSPRWPPEEMASRILNFLKVKVPLFLRDPSSNRKTGFFSQLLQSASGSLGGSFDSPVRGNSPPPTGSPSRLANLLSGKIGDATYDPAPTSR